MKDEVPGERALVAAASALFDGDGRAAWRWLAESLGAPTADGAKGLTPEDLRSLAATADAVRGAADGWTAESAGLLREHLPRALNAATIREGVLAPLLLYIRYVCEEAWELTSNHAPMFEVIDVVEAQWRTIEPRLGDQVKPEHVCWELLEFLRRELAFESALFAGALSVVDDTVAAAHSRIGEVAAMSLRLAPEWPLRELVVTEAEREEVYYACVREASRATCAYLARESTTVKPAIAKIEATLAGSDLSAIDASEVRTHVAALESLERARDRDWLRVDEGQVVVLYPFSLRSERSDVSDQVVTYAINNAEEWTLAGMRPTGSPSRALAISDSWQGDDALGRHFRGTEVPLPDLAMRQHAPTSHAPGTRGERSRAIRVKVQFSALGNHMVRFEIDVANALPGDLAEIISMASPVFGNLEELSGMISLVRADDAPDAATRWPRLADVAKAIIHNVSEYFGQGTELPATVSSRRGMHSVITVVHRAQVFAGSADPEGTPAREARALPSMFGAQPLVHPRPGGAASGVDWASYDVDPTQRFSLRSLNDELLVANANTTLLASFRSPSYEVRKVRSYIEFAHSLQGMYAGWNDEVAGHAQEIAKRLDEVDRFLKSSVDTMDGTGAEELRGALIEIERADLRLQRFLQSNNATMLFIASPALVRSSAVRLDLDTILESSGYSALRQGFIRAKDEVLGNRLQELLGIAARRIAERVEAEQTRQTLRSRRILDAVAVGIAVIGLSGLISVLQSGYDGLKGWPSLFFVVALVALAVAFVAVSWRSSAERGAQRRRRADRARWRRRGRDAA